MEKYYKVLNKDGKSTQSGFDYTPYLPKDDSAGDWLPVIEELEMCSKGYHITKYWNQWTNVFNENSRIYEVEFKGKQSIIEHFGVEEKVVCKTIRLLKDVTAELSPAFLLSDNSGNRNSGNGNSGNGNSGDRNSGNCNSGDFNSGYRNSGNYNSGYRNSGNGNSGNGNSGYFNCGNYNSGDYNSGNCNSGNFNSGKWNKGNYQTGYFCIGEPKVVIFNKETDVKRDDIHFPIWIYVNSIDSQSWRKAFDEADIDDVAKTLKLPNFDYEIFEEITGISKADFDTKLKGAK